MDHPNHHRTTTTTTRNKRKKKTTAATITITVFLSVDVSENLRNYAAPFHHISMMMIFH